MQGGENYCEGPREAVECPSLELLKHDWRSPEQPFLVGPTFSKSWTR